jgi:uncharacterized repeat protein (TIGR03806 family)
VSKRAAAVLASCALALLACGTADEPAAPRVEPDASIADAAADAAEREPDAAPHANSASVPRPTRDGAQHCVLRGTPSDSLPRIELEPVEGVRFDQAVAVVARPSEPDALYAVEQRGRFVRVDLSADLPPQTVLLDLSSTLGCCEGGRGLFGVAFDPAYDDNGQLFAFYVSGTPRRVVVASFRVDAATGQASPDSERPVLSITLPGEERSGGALLFDQDGMLLVGLGDGGENDGFTPPDPRLGAILRLDVHGSSAAPYTIPDDNPFVPVEGEDEPEHPPEVLAYGFADPAICHLDPETGQLWCIDHGEHYSEINAIEPGRDHGWPEVENVICVATQRLCLDRPVVFPIAAYLNVEGQCGSIGAVPLLAPRELEGAIAYADACTGAIYGVGARGDQQGKRSSMGGAQAQLAVLGRDAGGALVVIDEAGALFRARVVVEELPGTFPERLSETGCFEGARLSEPADDLVAFDVRSPLWSDGTHKRRFMVLPDATRIEVSDEGPWQFPAGAIMVKEFALPFDDRDPSSVRPIETRFMVRRAAGWEFHSFRWNDEGTDAVRVQREETADFEVMRGGRPYTQSYLYPSSATCPVCHSAAPGRALGPRTEQLNFELAYEGGAQNQIEALASLELFDRMPGQGTTAGLDTLPSLPDPRDGSLPFELRVRSYLQANCAHCHQPGGYSSPDLKMDLRFSLPLAETNICDRAPQFFNDAPKLIAPGDPESSALWMRMRATDLTRMPPVATSEVDPLATVLMTRWIQELKECPDPHAD